MQPKLSNLLRVLTLTLFGLCFFQFISEGQETLLKDRVVDAATKKGVEGADVLIQNTMLGVTTAADASFSINSTKGAVLVISSINFEQQLVTATKDFLNIALNAASLKLNE